MITAEQSSSSSSSRSETPYQRRDSHYAPVQRTLEDVREQVSQEVAYRAVRKAIVVDDVKVGVTMISSKTDDIGFLKLIASVVEEQLRVQNHLFAIATTGIPKDGSINYVIVCGSIDEHVQRAILLTTAKFVDRLDSAFQPDSKTWIAGIKELGSSIYDEDALWDVVRKASRRPIDDPLNAPPGSIGVAQKLMQARARLQRLTPREAYRELLEPHVDAPTFLVDIRPALHRERDGGILSSLTVERNLLEWKFDPRSESRLNIADRYDLRIIIFCDEGNASSFAADSLQEIGLLMSTDIIGGYRAWKDAGLPVVLPQSAMD
ncbi:hypothetical protein C8J56DRAFT_864106 [Mycena floridula]|nr:hypothetical protein C8J56DRAFT_864106 [Mycena floridula]